MFGELGRAALARQVATYLDKQALPFVQLLDGGAADILTARGPLEASASRGGLCAVTEDSRTQDMRWFVLVNGEGQSGAEADRSDAVPSIVRVAQAAADVPPGRHSDDSRVLLRESLARWADQTAKDEGRPLRTFCIEVSLQHTDLEPDLQRQSRLPTRLSLPPDDVRARVEAGRRSFLLSPALARLLDELLEQR